MIIKKDSTVLTSIMRMPADDAGKKWLYAKEKKEKEVKILDILSTLK